MGEEHGCACGHHDTEKDQNAHTCGCGGSCSCATQDIDAETVKEIAQEQAADQDN